MPELIVGIDLGTTNSEVAVVENGRPRVILVDGDPILPSVVGLADDGRLLVGKPARNQLVAAPHRTVKSVKRRMGEDDPVTLGDQTFRPQEVSAVILKKLKAAAEADLGRPVHKAVITVPAYFNDTQRQATREAGELAGLEVVRILNEPTAAALTYEPNPAGRERFLVYDLGGGTFDVSVVQAEVGVFEVLASHGDTKLGGDDFDQLLADHLAADFRDLFAVDLKAAPPTAARLLAAAEQAKMRLSDHPYTRVEEEFIAERDGVPLHLNVEVERSAFEGLIRPLLDKTMGCVQQALDDAGLVAANIDRVVLVGGSTRVPLIGQLLEARLGKPPSREVHPDLCVALGAAVQAALAGGSDVGAVLVDITPHTLGVKSLEYPDRFNLRPNEWKFSPIVPRGSTLPASRSEVFCTVADNQQTVEIEVYQGESGDVRRNHRIGKLQVEGLARAAAGNPIVVQLDLTLDGTLKVTAREKATGLNRQATMDNALQRFAVEERAAARERLDRLWGDEPTTTRQPADLPRLDAGPAEGQRETVQARALLEKVARLSATASDEDKVELETLATKVREALADRRWSDLAAASGELSDVLFYLEDA